MLVNKVYKFGLIPKNNSDKIENIFKYLNRYYNDLIELKRAKELYWSNYYSASLNSFILEKNDKYQTLLKVEEQIKNQRISSQSKKDDLKLIKLLDDAKNDLKLSNKSYYDALKIKQKEVSQEEKDRVHYLETIMIKSIRSKYVSNYNLYWGSYNLIEEAVNNAEQSKFKTRNGRNSALKFKTFDNSGRIGIQLQKNSFKNRFVNDIFKEDSEFKNLISVKKHEYLEFKKGVNGKRSQQKASLQFCIGTEQAHKKGKKDNLLYHKDGNPKLSKPTSIFAEFDIILHRDLPKDAILKSAVINKKILGSKIEWSIDLTICYDEVKPQTKNGKAIAYDLGWRNIKDSNYRIASWKDSDNKQGFIQLNISALEKADDLKSILDRNFNYMKANLHEFIKNEDSPEFLRKHKFINKYLSYDKLIKLFKYWEYHRFSGDIDIFNGFSYWFKKHTHLYDWESSLRRSFLRNRKEQFLKIAKENSKNYEFIIFEDLKLDNMAKGKVAGGQRQRVSPSEFKNCFKYRFNSFEKDELLLKTTSGIIEIAAKNTSKTCHKCNALEELDSQNTKHTCTKCKFIFDRDINGAINILKKGKEKADKIILLDIFDRTFACEQVNDEETAAVARNDDFVNEVMTLCERRAA